MPEPTRRPPWQIDDKLGGWPIWSLVEQRATIQIECDSCPHFAQWTPADLDRKFRKARGDTFARIAPKLRCTRCRSNWVRVSLAKGSFLAS
ncbi:hypothetical protein [Phenylobacterium montanum]|uniref:Uncharacterized protein n=1 Tax=Phenylobacterium montanum TaxID=2823693 RepID=A0A975G5T1_9CAUL|nr:hypothetical protein [Caulobacter sp. S6]QUD90581.1 hypothetical protein KCG34_12270 [Caulobacter sp. S6]